MQFSVADCSSPHQPNAQGKQHPHSGKPGKKEELARALEGRISGNPGKKEEELELSKEGPRKLPFQPSPILPFFHPPTGYWWSLALCTSALTGHRQVGQALKHLPSNSNNDAQGNTVVFHNGNVPWQRVISSNGIIPVR